MLITRSGFPLLHYLIEEFATAPMDNTQGSFYGQGLQDFEYLLPEFPGPFFLARHAVLGGSFSTALHQLQGWNLALTS